KKRQSGKNRYAREKQDQQRKQHEGDSHRASPWGSRFTGEQTSVRQSISKATSASSTPPKGRKSCKVQTGNSRWPSVSEPIMRDRATAFQPLIINKAATSKTEMLDQTAAHLAARADSIAISTSTPMCPFLRKTSGAASMTMAAKVNATPSSLPTTGDENT